MSDISDTESVKEARRREELGERVRQLELQLEQQRDQPAQQRDPARVGVADLLSQVVRRYPKDPNETPEAVKKMFDSANYNGVVPLPLLHRPCDRCVRALGQYPRTVCKPGAASCQRCSAMKKSCSFTVSVPSASRYLGDG